MTCIFLFPGQGSQKKGMGQDLFPRYRRYVELASDELGYSLERLCLEDPDGLLGRTDYTQPALYTVNALAYYNTTPCWPRACSTSSPGSSW
jgi:malonyl CoA-acyl carrier protein transacylase